MRLTLSLIASISLWHIFQVDDAAVQLGQEAQIICAKAAPGHVFRHLTSAMVCGTSIQGQTSTEIFRNSGLLHILVVSGAHLHFFALFLSKLKMRNPIIIPFLAIYTIFSGWQPPTVRSLIQIGMQSLSSRFELNLSHWQLVWTSGLLSLILFPEWIKGSSLLLSWICALVLSVSANNLASTFLIFGSLLPVLMKWMPPHPLTILINLLMSPVMGILALPLCLLTFVFPILTTATDSFWLLVLSFLKPVQPVLNFVTPAQSSNAPIWITLFICHLLWEVFYVRRQQKRALLRALDIRSLRTH
jgi:competence protein ComEC